VVPKVVIVTSPNDGAWAKAVEAATVLGYDGAWAKAMETASRPHAKTARVKATTKSAATEAATSERHGWRG
jgi:hypothetical protein